MSGCLDRVVVSIAIAGLASGCGRVKAPGGGGGSDGGSGGGLTVAADPDHFIVRQGASQTVQVTVSGQDASQDVTVELTGLPGGVSADPVTVPAGASDAQLSVSATATAGQGAFDVMLAASIDGGDAAQAPVRLLVGGPPGTPDQSFADGGTFKTMAGGTTVGRGLLVQADGRIVVTGGTATAAVTYRLMPDGSADTGFGTGGLVTTTGTAPNSEGIVVMSPGDGRIVVGGLTGNYNASDTDVALFSYDGSGQLDSSFGSGGIATTDLGTGYAEVHSVQAAAGGSLLAVGPLFGQMTQSHVVQFDPQGLKDDTYNDPIELAVPESSLVDGQGRLVVVGSLSGEVWLARYKPDGMPDLTFGGGADNNNVMGRVMVDLGGTDTGYAVIGLPGGKLLVVGVEDSGSADANLAVTRLLPDGARDTSFSPGGSVRSGLAFDTRGPGAAAVDDQGRILVAGFSGSSDAPDFSVARLLPTGQPDTSFGTGGIAVVNFSASNTGSDGAYGIALDPDGRILASGTVGPSGTQNLAVARLWP